MYQKRNKELDVISLYTGDYKAEFYLRQIGKLARLPLKTCQNILSSLEKERILKSTVEGKNKYFSINIENISVKSYLLKAEIHKADTFLEKYPEFRYLSFDDPNVCNLAKENPQGFLLQISRGAKAIFIDEFQKVPEITLAVKYLYDSQKDFPKIFMSGSISDSLTAGGDSMVGRVMRFPLYSLSFGEYLDSRGVKKATGFSPEQTTALTGEFDHYLQNGGYPATVFEDSQNLPVFFENLRRGFWKKICWAG